MTQHSKTKDDKRAAKHKKVKEFGELSKETHSDTDGSYTGNPLYDDHPVQDADDL